MTIKLSCFSQLLKFHHPSGTEDLTTYSKWQTGNVKWPVSQLSLCPWRDVFDCGQWSCVHTRKLSSSQRLSCCVAW